MEIQRLSIDCKLIASYYNLELLYFPTGHPWLKFMIGIHDWDPWLESMIEGFMIRIHEWLESLIGIPEWNPWLESMMRIHDLKSIIEIHEWNPRLEFMIGKVWKWFFKNTLWIFFYCRWGYWRFNWRRQPDNTKPWYQKWYLWLSTLWPSLLKFCRSWRSFCADSAAFAAVFYVPRTIFTKLQKARSFYFVWHGLLVLNEKIAWIVFLHLHPK